MSDLRPFYGFISGSGATPNKNQRVYNISSGIIYTPYIPLITSSLVPQKQPVEVVHEFIIRDL